MEKGNTISSKVKTLKSVSVDPPVRRVWSLTDSPIGPMENANNPKFEFYFDYSKHIIQWTLNKALWHLNRNWSAFADTVATLQPQSLFQAFLAKNNLQKLKNGYGTHKCWLILSKNVMGLYIRFTRIHFDHSRKRIQIYDFLHFPQALWYVGCEILKTLCTGRLPCTNFIFLPYPAKYWPPPYFKLQNKKKKLSPLPSTNLPWLGSK